MCVCRVVQPMPRLRLALRLLANTVTSVRRLSTILMLVQLPLPRATRLLPACPLLQMSLPLQLPLRVLLLLHKRGGHNAGVRHHADVHRRVLLACWLLAAVVCWCRRKFPAVASMLVRDHSRPLARAVAVSVVKQPVLAVAPLRALPLTHATHGANASGRGKVLHTAIKRCCSRPGRQPFALRG